MNTQAVKTKSAWKQGKQESKPEEGVSEQVRGVRVCARAHAHISGSGGGIPCIAF